MKVKKIVILLLSLSLLLFACGNKADVSGTIFCMDTVMELQLWGEEAQNAYGQLTQLLQQMETQWDADADTSVVPLLEKYEDAALRADGQIVYEEDPETGEIYETLVTEPTIFTPEQSAVAQRALELKVRTEGAFDPQLYALTSLWGFRTGDYCVPDQAQIQAALSGARWDLGAAIKGYAGDQAAELLEQMDVDCALLNLGGNVQTYGTKRNGKPWVIGIRDPANLEKTVGQLEVHGTCSVITSGGYQRYFEENGMRYHHILDPYTGRPVDKDLASVTVICTDGMTGDALSTALFVMGSERAVEHWQQSSDFEAVLVLTNGEVWATEGAAFTGSNVKVIHREN